MSSSGTLAWRGVTHSCFFRYLGFSCRIHVHGSLRKAASTLTGGSPTLFLLLNGTFSLSLGGYSIFNPCDFMSLAPVPPPGPEVLADITLSCVCHENSRCHFSQPSSSVSRLRSLSRLRSVSRLRLNCPWNSPSSQGPRFRGCLRSPVSLLVGCPWARWSLAWWSYAQWSSVGKGFQGNFFPNFLVQKE